MAVVRASSNINKLQKDRYTNSRGQHRGLGELFFSHYLFLVANNVRLKKSLILMYRIHSGYFSRLLINKFSKQNLP
jgi:hypothetical protein